MPEETEPAPQDGPPPAPAPPWGSDDQFDPAKAWSLIQNLRGDVEKQKTRVNELLPFEQAARELEDAQKTEAQRLAEQLAAAQADATQARSETLRLRVATAKGLPAALAARLQGATEEEMSADADALLAAFPQPPAPPAGRTPVEALRPGALPNPPEQTLADRIAEAERAGDWATARQLKSHQLMELQRNNR